MSSTERSNQRAAKLAAKAMGREMLADQIEGLRAELRATGLPQWARRLAEISCSTAIKEVAAYTKRNARFFALDGVQSPSLEARSKRERHIHDLADKLDLLADSVPREAPTYRQFELILNELQGAGFFPEGGLVSDVATAFHRLESP
jgi:hypothetical protein